MFGKKTVKVPEELPELPADAAQIQPRGSQAVPQSAAKPVQARQPAWKQPQPQQPAYEEEPAEEQPVAQAQKPASPEVADAIKALKEATIVGVEGLTPGEAMICNLLFAILVEARRP